MANHLHIQDFWIMLIAASAAGGSAAYLGSLMISRQMALVGDALGHVALPGMGIALILGLDPSLGAFVFLGLGILLIWKLGEKTPLSMETLVGITFVSSLALGFIIIPKPDLLENLIGDISKINIISGTVSSLISGVVFLIVRRIYPGMMLMNVSPDLAQVEGISVRSLNLIYLFSVALIVSLAVKITGTLLVGALLIVPPAAARMASSCLKHYVRLSISIGVLSSIGGIFLSQATHFPPGPSIIVISVLFFLLALMAKKRSRPTSSAA